MSSLLLVNGVLSLFAMRRGWRVAPFVLLAAPTVLARLEPSFPPLVLAGWALPFANLLVVVAGLCSCSLAYTAIADPERP